MRKVIFGFGIQNSYAVTAPDVNPIMPTPAVINAPNPVITRAMFYHLDMLYRVSALLAAQESSQSVPDADESQDTPAIELEQIRTFSRKLSVWKIEDSEMGPGEIEASVEANAVDQLIDLTLRWKSGEDQPEVWGITWSHFPGYLLRELPEYLRRFCPVANEMIEVLGWLGLEDFPNPGDDEEELETP